MIGADTGQNAIIVLPRANHALAAEAVEEAMRSLLAQRVKEQTTITGVFMAQCEMRMATVEAGLRLAHTGGMTTIFNMAPVPREPLGDTLFTLVDILIVNESEAASLAGILVDSPTSAQAAAERLLSRGPRHVIITLGALGCLWSTVETGDARPVHRQLQAIAVTQVDATAAGDAFCGALAAKLAEGMLMMEALRWANAAGAVTVTRNGAFPSLPTAGEVETLL
jgi:ribokinase